MPNKPAATKIRLTLWIDRDLLARYRALVPRGQQQKRIRQAIAGLVSAEELAKGQAMEEEHGNGVASNHESGKSGGTAGAGNRTQR